MSDFEGSIGDDSIVGTNDNDVFRYLGGDDVYTGGLGDDIFNASGLDIPDGGSLRAIGGAGDDELRFSAFALLDLSFQAGNGNDTAHIIFGDENSQFNVNLGSGNDSVFIGRLWTGADFRVSGQFNITLGQGQDRLALGELEVGSVVISDFEVGDLGDVVELITLSLFTNWDGSENLFATGHLALIQDGNDTLLRVDYDGAGVGSTRDIIRFTDVVSSDLTSANFSGLAPDGSPVIGETINGTASSETLEGTFGADIINGFGGNDIITGGAGNDQIDGGAGNDNIESGLGDDTALGGEGNDDFTYFGGDDVYTGGLGDDIFNASGLDIPDGGSLRIIGGAGDDALRFSAFVTTDLIFLAGNGNDTAHVIFGDTNSQFTLNLGNGDDSVFIGQLWTGAEFGVRGQFNITLGDGQDSVSITSIGFDFNSVVLPLESSFTILDFEAGSSGDVLNLGFSDFIGNWDGIENPFETGAARILQDGSDAIIQFEVFSITFGNSTSTAQAWTDVITLRNVDVLDLTAENFAGFSVGTISYTEETSDVNIRLSEAGIGSDVVNAIGGFGDDIIFGTSEVNRLDGGSGNDEIRAGNGNDILNGDAGEDQLFGQNGADTINGGDGNDLTFGGTGDDVLNGDAGDDILMGQSGNDILNGGDGDDTLNGNSGDDVIDGGSGNDTVNGGGGDDTIIGGVGNDNISGAIGEDFIRGGNGADVIFGNNQNDMLLGQSGSDTIDGGAGNDVIDGGFGNDTLIGGAGQDELLGGEGDDVLNGNSGGDDLFGGAGHDILNGGGGNDILNGGIGADQFIFDLGFGTDRIQDFEEGIDQIDLSGNSLADDFADVLASASQVGANIRIELNPNNILVIENLNIEDLDSSDFIF